MSTQENIKEKPAKSKAIIPNWVKDAVIYEVNIRQYTKEGTFKAFQEHLPRLKKLGVDVLWIMPVHPISKTNRLGSLGSYYAISDYREINPEFGTKEDFRDLINHAKEMGFYVIMDWVANHTGWDHPWVTEHPEYYDQDENDQVICNKEWIDVAQLDYSNQELGQKMKAEILYWATEYPIDGFRADHAKGVPTEIWEEISMELNKIKPMFMLAEDCEVYDLLNQAFFINWGWGLLHTMNRVAQGTNNKQDIITHFSKYAELYPEGTYPMQFIDSHDENSWEGTVKERMGDAALAMATLTFTASGIPMMYSGQESCLAKRLAFFEKEEIDWKEYPLQEFYEQLIQLKKANQALWNGLSGGEMQFLSTSSDYLLAFERRKNDNTVIVLINLSNEQLTDQVLSEGLTGNYQSVFEKKDREFSNEYQVSLQPWEYRLLVK